jgi:hypothetical protein
VIKIISMIPSYVKWLAGPLKSFNYIYIYIPFAYQTGGTQKMGYFQPCKKLACCLLIVLAMVLSLTAAGSCSQVRLLPEVEVSKLRVVNSNEKNLRTLATMLPKGPVPPSGPSPGIN